MDAQSLNHSLASEEEKMDAQDARYRQLCQSALKIDPPSASKIDPPQVSF